MEEIQQLLKTRKVIGNDSTFNMSNVEIRQSCFLDNYIKPQINSDSLGFDVTSTHRTIKGKIVGYRGCFIYLHNGNIIDLNKLKSLISSCNIFVCGDTGPLHFSFALGIPTIGIFLQGNYEIYGYADGDKNFIIKPANTWEFVHKPKKHRKNRSFGSQGNPLSSCE